MTTVEMRVVRVRGLHVWAESPEGHAVSFGDVKWWQPKVGDAVLVELDSDEYPVRAWFSRGTLGKLLVWP